MSQIDSGLVNSVRRAERRWVIQRWINLAYALIAIGFGLYLLRTAGFDGQMLLAPVPDGSAPYRAFQDSFMSAIGFMGLIGGVVLTMFTIARFRGNPTRQLLLKMFDESAGVK